MKRIELTPGRVCKVQTHWNRCAMTCPRTRGSSLELRHPGDTGVNRLSLQQENRSGIQGFLLLWDPCLPSHIRLATRRKPWSWLKPSHWLPAVHLLVTRRCCELRLSSAKLRFVSYREQFILTNLSSSFYRALPWIRVTTAGIKPFPSFFSRI